MIEYFAQNPFSTVGMVAYAIAFVYINVKGSNDG